VECYYLRSSVDIVCDAHNTLWCGRNERECEIPEREGEYIIGIVSDTLQNYRIKHHYRVKMYMRIIGLHFYLFYIYIYIYMCKVKESRNRPGVAQRVPGGLGSQIS